MSLYSSSGRLCFFLSICSNSPFRQFVYFLPLIEAFSNSILFSVSVPDNTMDEFSWQLNARDDDNDDDNNNNYNNNNKINKQIKNKP